MYGRGETLDKAETKKQGVPVFKTCPKCSSRGYSGLLAEDVRREICSQLFELPKTTWRRNFKPFYEMLIQECFKEEAITPNIAHPSRNVKIKGSTFNKINNHTVRLINTYDSEARGTDVYFSHSSLWLEASSC